MTWAARLIERHFDAAHSLRGEAATVQRWLTPLPAELVRSRPRLLLTQAVPAATGGRLEAAEQLVDAAERAYADQGAEAGDEPFEPTIGPAGSLLVNVPAAIALVRGYLAQLRGDARSTAEFGSRAVAESREDEWILRSVAQVQLAVAGWLDGRLDEAERAFADGIAGRRAVGLPTWGAWASYELGQVQYARGRLDAAVRTSEQALEAAARTGQPPSPTAGPAYVSLAELAYQRNELDRALDNAERGIALCRSFVYTMPLAAVLATLAWIRQAGGDPAGALDAMDEAVRASPGPPPGLLNPIPARRAQLLLAQGNLAAAARWTQENNLSGEPDYVREPGHLVLARVLLAQSRPGPALALLNPMHAAAVAQDRVGSLIEIGMLRALALAASGQDADAVNVLAGVLTLACPQGYVRVFADEGPPMAALLAQLIAAQRSGSGFEAAAEVPLGCLSRLQGALSTQGVAPDAGLVDPLTSRELEVLELLAAGASNQGIASQLVVTLDTVKKHVSHVLSKLGAANRTGAVARARELGLIP